MGAAGDPLQTASQHGSHPAGQSGLPRRGTRVSCPLQYCMFVFKELTVPPASTICKTRSLQALVRAVLRTQGPADVPDIVWRRIGKPAPSLFYR